ncbi:16S rRNA (guanine(966)-N(2))-methyltransferase [hydrothermal vent metagenome]|uniref:16S rRNA (Guanine(966)-N(2))-methyltransferase n=1 Tax=hydrothermal vent metagenome TaxID=652676 RepID=A0A3B1AQA2_9ZZZZ
MNNSVTAASQVRIIAGRWRARKISFATHLSIRPTPDRVRETVFNWLAPYVINSRCLDLFAGSGVLGFEALSRGASEMVFVDSEKTIITQLRAQHQILNIDAESTISRVEYLHTDANAYLSTQQNAYDVIFLDPPYQKNKIPVIIEQLIKNALLNNNGIIYIEMAKDEIFPELPNDWKLIKHKIMSQVACYLIQVSK